MCTCINFRFNNKNYFGRTLDSIEGYNLSPLIIPRNYKIKYRQTDIIDKGYSIIGMGTVIDNYPLMAEASNEYGLSMAGLEFVEYAHYFKVDHSKINIPSFELILFILRQCKNIEEALIVLNDINITDEDFNSKTKSSQLHWMISYKNKSIVIESTIDGIHIYDNPYHVMTNNPRFYYHLENIKNYVNLTKLLPLNKFVEKADIEPNSNGIGGFGLPGDYSSASRFIKAVFLNNNVPNIKDGEVINHYFNMLGAVAPLKGIVLTDNKKYNYTIYSSCIDVEDLSYYYKTYNSSAITKIKLKENLMEKDYLIKYELIEQKFICSNE